jgi:hypothetical protein
MLWEFMTLGLGDINQNGAMSYDCSIISDFSGVGNITQLVNRDMSRDLVPTQITTGGAFCLDTSEWYNQVDAAVLPGSESWLNFSDMPGVPVGRTFITIEDYFQDYVRFKPDGEDSIWITIARVDWSWFGSATSANGWVPPSGSVEPPVKLDDDTFPFWLDVARGVVCE